MAQTPQTSDAMKLRMLVVYGSQTGSCKRLATKMAESWKQRGVVQACEVMEGNELAHETEDLASLKESYDVLVVCTSSYGDGEPPENYGEFLTKLLLAVEAGAKPLAGMHHAVLGEGSSVYRETFQNCPRLTDKYLEELGGRRFVARHETDVGGEEDESVSRSAFREAVFLALDKGLPSADAPPAAVWAEPVASHTEPKTQISVKTVAELGGGHGQSLGQLVFPLVVGALAVCGGAYYYLYGE